MKAFGFFQVTRGLVSLSLHLGHRGHRLAMLGVQLLKRLPQFLHGGLEMIERRPGLAEIPLAFFPLFLGRLRGGGRLGGLRLPLLHLMDQLVEARFQLRRLHPLFP